MTQIAQIVALRDEAFAPCGRSGDLRKLARAVGRARNGCYWRALRGDLEIDATSAVGLAMNAMDAIGSRGGGLAVNAMDVIGTRGGTCVTTTTLLIF